MNENTDCNEVRLKKKWPTPRTCKVCGMESPDKFTWSIRIGKTVHGRTMAEIRCDDKIIARKGVDPRALTMGAMLLGRGVED
jgi:hypothetical protein